MATAQKRQAAARDEYRPPQVEMTKFLNHSRLVNTAYAFLHNLDPEVRTLFKHVVEEARIAAGIPRAPHGKIFMGWDERYGNPVRDKNTQTKGLAYWEPT